MPTTSSRSALVLLLILRYAALMGGKPRASERLDRQLRGAYGFDFPQDLVQMWDFIQQRQPVDQTRPFDDVLGFGAQLSLSGPFDVLAEKRDRVPNCSPLVHWRFRYDPPEFFTVFTGDSDGESWGYWFDDPGRLQPVIAAYHRNDAYEFTVLGNTMFAALRLHVEQCIGSEEDAATDDPDEFDPERVKNLRAFSTELSGKPGAGGSGEGWDYKGEPAVRKPNVPSSEGMGIQVPADSITPFKIPNKKDKEAVARAAKSAAEKCRNDFPGTALLLGRELWGWQEHTDVASDLLIMAYEQLDRGILAKVVEEHRKVRAADHVLTMF